MKKNYYFIRFELKNGDIRYFFSRSKRRCSQKVALWHAMFDKSIRLSSTNLPLK